MALLGSLVSFAATPSLSLSLIEILTFYCYITNRPKAAGLRITVIVVYASVCWLRLVGLEPATHGLGETHLALVWTSWAHPPLKMFKVSQDSDSELTHS